MPSDFTDFLKKCLNKDERDRWSAPQLLEHSWIKNRLDHIPTQNPNHSAILMMACVVDLESYSKRMSQKCYQFFINENSEKHDLFFHLHFTQLCA